MPTIKKHRLTASIHCGGELCSDAVHLLAPSLLFSDRRFFSSKKTMQKIRLRSSHGKLQTKAISAPYAQSYFVACFCRLGDVEKMERKMLGAFSSHFLNVGYS
jgi:hypothetical protein